MIGAPDRGKRKYRKSQPKTILVRERWYWRILWMFLVPLLLFLALAFVFSLVPPASDWVPFTLHSVLASDYSSDLHATRLPELNIRVIEEVMVDRGAPTVPGRMATLQVVLLTPVPSVTPTAPLGGGQPPGNDSNPTPTLPEPGDKEAPTQTPLASATGLPTPTTTPTNPPTATPTLSPTPTATWLPPVLPSPTKSKPTNPPPTKVPSTKIPPTQPPPTRISPTATQPPPPTQPPPTKTPKPYPGPPPTPKATPYP